MTPDIVPTAPTGRYPSDGLSGATSAAPAPTGTAEVVARADSEIAAATADATAAIESVLAQAETEIGAAESDVNISVAGVVGSADTEMGAAESTEGSILRRTTDDVYREIVYAEETLRGAGIAVPYATAEVVADLADPTGDATIARLSGVYPAPADTGASTGVGTPVPGVGGLSAGLPGAPYPPTVSPALSPPPPAASADSSPPPPPVACPECAGGGGTSPPPGTLSPEGGPSPLPPPPPVGSESLPGDVILGADLPVPPPPAPPPLPAPAPSPVPPPPALPPNPLPPPVVPVVSVSAPYTSPALFWGAPDVCAQATASVAGKADPGETAPAPESPGLLGKIQSELSEMWRTAGEVTDWIGSGFDPRVIDEIRARNGAVVAASGIGSSVAGRMIREAVGPGLQNPGAAIWYGARIGLAGTAERLSTIPMTYLAQNDQYLFQYANPQYIVEQSELNRAYLCAAITLDAWTCLTRAHGNLPESHRLSLESAQQRLDANAVMQLYMRGELTWPDVISRTRALGYLDDKYARELAVLAKWTPQPPDLVTFMTRDVFDPSAVALGRLDEDFEVKFYGPGGASNPGPAARWAAVHGLDAESFRLFWRAHWQWPSPTMLYDALHRLRPDRPEVKSALDDWGNWDVNGRIGPEPVVPPYTDAAEVREVLKVNDLAPGWVDRLMALSYLPMNRTDAIAAFVAGAMNADELLTRFRDNGYDLPTATRMVEIQTMLRNRRIGNVSGVWSVRKVVRAYKDGTVTAQQAHDLLQPLVPSRGQRELMLVGADLEISSEKIGAMIKRARRAYLIGEWDQARTEKVLVARGVPDKRAADLVDLWREDREGRLKEPTAKLIVSWMQDGLLSGDVALDRLRRLGYSGEDAERIAYQGYLRWGEKVTGKIEKAQAKVEKYIKDQKQAARELTQTLKDRQKELEKQVKAYQDEQARIQKQLDARKPEPPPP